MIRLNKKTGSHQAAWICCLVLVLSFHPPAFGSEESGLHSQDHAGMHDAVPDDAVLDCGVPGGV